MRVSAATSRVSDTSVFVVLSKFVLRKVCIMIRLVYDSSRPNCVKKSIKLDVIYISRVYMINTALEKCNPDIRATPSITHIPSVRPVVYWKNTLEGEGSLKLNVLL